MMMDYRQKQGQFFPGFPGGGGGKCKSPLRST